MRIANLKGRLALLTPSTRQPARFLEPGELLATTIEGIGTLRNRLVPASGR
jgi:2-keto-4-pentenoate hydratase/2-oxohepta-3-ene-1,7-dioic acid hydratase in catechol pathway